MAENRAKLVKKSIFQYFRPFLAYSDYFQKKKFFDDFSNFFFSQYGFFRIAPPTPKLAKCAEKPIFGVLAEAKMGVRVTKNRKKSKIVKIHPKTPQSLKGTHTIMLQHVGERYGHIWPNTLKGGGGCY